MEVFRVLFPSSSANLFWLNTIGVFYFFPDYPSVSHVEL